MDVVYFSNVSENTHRFVQKLDRPAFRIPVQAGDLLLATRPYILVTPTYGAGKLGGAVPKQVVKFLNDERNRTLLRGVIAGGNTNFGSAYCLSGEIIAAKCHVPLLYRFEVFGDSEDVSNVQTILTQLETETTA